jgi:peptidoglycan/LPS O-acetylase OafA/YrhL
MSRSLQQNHIASLNLLRGVAAVSVCLFHLLGGDRVKQYPWLQSVFNEMHLGLFLFFIISGFIIPYSMYVNGYRPGKFPLFLLKRAVRIEIPYIIAFHLMLLMMYVHQHIHQWPFELDRQRYWLHFGYLNQYFGKENYSAVFWTLAIEFQYYILIGLVFPLLMSRWKAITAAVLLAFAASAFFFNLHFNWFIFQFGFLFISGILVFFYKIRRLSFPFFLASIAAVVMLAYFRNGYEDAVIIPVGCAGILLIDREWKVTNFLGKISYSFYLVHLEATGWFMMYIEPYIPDLYLRIAAAFVFSILFATLFYRLFERPAFRLSKKIIYRDTIPAQGPVPAQVSEKEL